MLATMPINSMPELTDPLATSLFVAQALHAAARQDAANLLLRDLLRDNYNRYGIVLARQGLFGGALAAFDTVLAIQPEHAVAWSNRGNALHLLDRYEEALASNDQALAIDPHHVDAWHNRALILADLERFEEALACYDRVLALQPDHLLAIGNRGVTLHVLGRMREAIDCFTQVQTALPDNPKARFNESLARLAVGDFAEGWERYESRFDMRSHTPHQKFPQPRWGGEALPAGATLLIHAEQGYGDTLQFCRYVPLLPPQARVVLAVPAPLRRLLSTLAGERQIVTEADIETLPQIDLHCPLLSLPLIFVPDRQPFPRMCPTYQPIPRRRRPGVSAWCRCPG